jgi:hypothetical protein
MNYRVVAFPFLMWLATFGMYLSFPQPTATPPLTSLIQRLVSCSFTKSQYIKTGTQCFSITVALNVLLTLMIVTRLIWHSRNIRDAVGSPARGGGLYKTIITILIESSALYTVNHLCFLVSWSIESPLTYLFLPILVKTQVRAVFLFPGAPRSWNDIL